MAEEDARRDPAVIAALRRIAPGTELRHGIDDIIRGRHGALIVIGEPSELQFLFSGGLQLDQSFSSQFLFELAKMDGAIVLNQNATRIVSANIHLMPDPAVPTSETGTRHRTAERVARQTGALVISISGARETVTVYVGPIRYQLDPIAEVLAKANQAVNTLSTYRRRLEQTSARLYSLEEKGSATLDDVLEVLQRAEMATRMGDEIERMVIELGREGRLIDMQLAELLDGVPRDRLNLIRDYEISDVTGGPHKVIRRLKDVPYRRLLDFDVLADVLGYGAVNPLDRLVKPRGFRALAQIPRLPDTTVRSVVDRFGSLDDVLSASLRDLEQVDGVTAVQARDIREGLRRLFDQNVVERSVGL